LTLGKDLFRLAWSDEVDLIGAAGGQLKTCDAFGALGDVDVGEELVVKRRVRGHVGEVDVNNLRVGAN